MDPEALRDALDRWSDDEVIDESTADRIRAYEDRRSSEVGDDTGQTAVGLLGDRRLVAALALMGGVLVAVGVGTFLVDRWESIPVLSRAAVVTAVPVAAALAGHRLRSVSPLTGRGLWLLATLFTGVTVFQLADLASLDVDALEPWLLLVWTAVAFAIGTGLDSRPIAAVGAALGAAAIVTAIDGNGFLVVGFYGGVAYAAGLFAGAGSKSETPVPRFGATLRWVGGAFAVAVVAAVGIAGSPPPIADDAGTVAVAVASVLAAIVAVWRTRRAGNGRHPAGYAAAPAVATPLALAIAWAFGDLVGLGELALALVGLLCLLGLLVTLVVAAIGLRETALVNVATLGFVLGVGALLVGPVTDAVSGSLALVVAGVTLLAAGLAAERGRRSVLARIG